MEDIGGNGNRKHDSLKEGEYVSNQKSLQKGGQQRSLDGRSINRSHCMRVGQQIEIIK